MSEQKNKVSAKRVGGYVLKSTFMVTHAESAAESISNSYNNIKRILNKPQANTNDYGDKRFNFDKKGRLIPKTYDDIIDFQAMKLTARDMTDFLGRLPPEAEVDMDENNKKAANIYADYQKDLLKKAAASAKTFRLSARILGVAAIFTIASAATFAAKGDLIALLALPSSMLLLVAAFRYALRAAIHSERKLYSVKEFLSKHNYIGWVVA